VTTALATVTDGIATQPPTASPQAPAGEPTAPPAPPVAPVIAQGRTDLPDGLFADRSGDTVTVHFDTPQSRTRRRDKFERIVRETLPRIYGPPVEIFVASIPAGGLTQGGDLLGELPARGVRIPLSDGWNLTVWPATRPGQDGPLVVTYRAVTTR
jgi:hypothetical protein